MDWQDSASSKDQVLETEAHVVQASFIIRISILLKATCSNMRTKIQLLNHGKSFIMNQNIAQEL